MFTLIWTSLLCLAAGASEEYTGTTQNTTLLTTNASLAAPNPCLNQTPTLTIPPLAEGQPTNLTCTAAAGGGGLCSESQLKFTWMLCGAGVITENITDPTVNNVTNSIQDHISTLTLNISADHHNKKITCRVTCAGHTKDVTQKLKVKYSALILNNRSTCKVQSGVMTCVCVSEGFPLPTIEWTLFEDSPMYTIMTNVSEKYVYSTMTVSHKDPQNKMVQCVSKNTVGEGNATLTILEITTNKTSHLDVFKLLNEVLERPLLFVIVLGTGILIGILLSAIIACLAVKCLRKKKLQKSG
ncbi:uncharacterized protein [Nothobranchius furzeri]|uniref:Transcript variant X2 n=1 Tax=Nothobranchius furzeri TaxID=105023 RepID=A0A1A7ZFT4_NOTFU|nr:transcript variant X2 [Nothobranchius furzeri]